MTWLRHLLLRLGLVPATGGAPPVGYGPACDRAHVLAGPAATESMAFDPPPGALEVHGRHLARRRHGDLQAPRLCRRIRDLRTRTHARARAVATARCGTPSAVEREVLREAGGSVPAPVRRLLARAAGETPSAPPVRPSS
jgi:hypothetical protein